MQPLSSPTRDLRPARFRSACTRIVVCAFAVPALVLTTLLVTAPATYAQSNPNARDVYAFGSAKFLGSTGTAPLSHPIVGIAATPHGRGYRLVASDGGIFSFGDAHFYGSTGAIALNQPIVGIATTPTGHGYWLVASDGGIFTFGDAHFYGSTGAIALNQPIVGMTTTRLGHGYRLVAADGGIFTFGRAPYFGSAGSTMLTAPVVGMAATPNGRGYRVVTGDGRVFGFGDAVPAQTTSRPATGTVVGIASGADSQGYWLATADTMSSATSESAIAWFRARMGSTAFEGRCETAVENAYGTSQVYASARADWQARPDQHADWQNAPRGALVFYDTSSDGHVAISLGDGTVISSAADHRIGVVPIGYFQNPLGWAASPW
jgi:hypothetical protein